MADQEDFTKLSLADKLGHKLWKARIMGHGELKNAFEQEEGFKQYQDALKPLLCEANLVALESGVNVVSVFIKNAPRAMTLKLRSMLVSNLVEKCLGSNRTQTRNFCVECLTDLIELDKSDLIVTELLSTITTTKQPKFVVSCVKFLRQNVEVFGAKVMGGNEILKKVAFLFAHSDKGVRDESVLLVLEMIRWMGEQAFQSTFKELKPIQVKEMLETLARTEKVPTRPTRFLLSEKKSGEGPVGDGDATKTQESALQLTEEIEEKEDVADNNEPVDVLALVPANFDNDIVSSKWKERKEALDCLLAILSVPKMAEGHYHSLVTSLVKAVHDVNIACGMTSIACLDKIACALGGRLISPYRSMMLKPLLEKFKEKKQAVVAALRSCLDAVSSRASVADILDDSLTCCSNNNPQIRTESFLFISRCVLRCRGMDGKSDLKRLGTLCAKMIEDSFTEVRDAVAECMGAMMLVLGEKVMLSWINKINPVRHAKINDFYSKFKEAGGSGSVPSLVSKSNVVVLPSKTAFISTPTLSKKRTSTSQSSKAPKNTPNSQQENHSPNIQHSSAATVPTPTAREQPIKFRFSNVDLSTQSVLPQSTIDLLNDSVWKQRVEGLQLCCDAVSKASATGNAVESAIDPELLLTVVSSTLVWKDVNVNVMVNVMELIRLLSLMDTFNRACASMCIFIMDKAGEAKLKQRIVVCLTQMRERTDLSFILRQVYQPLLQQKSPKVMSEDVFVLHELIKETAEGGALDGVDVMELLNFLKTLIVNPSPLVRTQTISLLKSLKGFIGTVVDGAMSDLPGNILSTLQSELQSVTTFPSSTASNADPSQSLNSVGLKASLPSSSSFSSSSAKETIVHSDSLSKVNAAAAVDLTTFFASDLIGNLNHSNWKVRKEGLDALLALLHTHSRIKSSLGGDLLPALKNRLSDSNKNLVIVATEAVGCLATCMESGFDRGSGGAARTLLPAVLNCLCDNKAQVRVAALKTLTLSAAHASVDSLAAMIAAALQTDNPTLRRDLLSFLLLHRNLASHADIAGAVARCSTDRSSEVRRAVVALNEFLETGDGGSVQNLNASTSGEFEFVLIFGVARHSSASIGIKSSATATVPPKDLVKKASRKSKDSLLHTQSQPNLLPAAAPPSHLKNAATHGSTKATSKHQSLMELSDASPTPPTPTSSIFLSSDTTLKTKRSQEDRGSNKWTTSTEAGGIRKELCDSLRDASQPLLSPSLHAQLFSTAHHKEKEFLSGLQCLLDHLQLTLSSEELGVSSAWIANLDVVLRYCSIRFYDTNTTMTLKVLDLLDLLFGALDAKSYQLMEFEANCFLPTLLFKLGDGKEVIRARVKRILRMMARVYPVSKLFSFLISLLSSKNSRARAECLEECGILVEKNGVSVCGVRHLSVISAQVADRDATVRNAAMNTLLFAYVQLGDAVYKHVGAMTDKDKSFLEERIRRSAAASSASTSDNQTAASPSFKRQTTDAATVADLKVSAKSSGAAESSRPTKKGGFSLDLESLQLPQLTATHSTVPFDSSLASSSLNFDFQHPHLSTSTALQPSPASTRYDAPSSVGSSSSDYTMDLLLTRITSGDLCQSIDALRQLEQCVTDDLNQVQPHMNQMVNAVTLQVRLAFTSPVLLKSDSIQLIRLCKHLVNSLVQMFSHRQLALCLNKETLRQVLAEILCRLVDVRLVDVRLQTVESGAQLVRALNVLMIRVLENSSKNHVFGVLLDLLDSSIGNVSSAASPSSIKYSDLVMKCLWKLTKSLQLNLQNDHIDIPTLLLDIHKFLTATPPSVWKRRAQEELPLGDMPLRTVKTILHELVLGAGEGVLGHLTLIHDPSRTTVSAYLTHMLQAAKKSTSAQSEETNGKSATLTSNAGKVSRESNVGGVTAASQLDVDAIFDLISSKDGTKQGLLNLYHFQKFAPSALEKVNIKLSQFGSNFQLYIRRALNRLAEEFGEPNPFNDESLILPTTASSTFSSSSRTLSSVYSLVGVGGLAAATSKDGADEAEGYKARLGALQQQFGYSSSNRLTATNSGDTTPLNSAESTKVQPLHFFIEFQQPSSTHPQINTMTTSTDGAGMMAGVEELKDRLAKMKHIMHGP